MESESNNKNSNFVVQYDNIVREKKEVDFLFVGQDPYPEGANGVAFCKNTYQEFFHDTCCGFNIMLSIGYARKDIYKNYNNPRELFIDLLLTKGIAFINVSNTLLSNLNEYELEKAIKDTKTANYIALQKAKKIILLGRGKTRSYFEKFYSEFKADYVLLHPSKNAKKNNENEWNDLWTKNYIEKNILNKTQTQIEVGLKVIGKIDLSKFEKQKKEIIQDKQNIYIIDTNVFIDCPDIISKIDKQYQIVLSAKVIDELDYLKISLTEEQQKNVQKSLRQINESIDKRNIKMDTADLTLLPNDFNKKSPDNFILSVALKYNKENPIMLTSDNALQIKAKGLGITTIKLKEFLMQMK